MARSAQRQHSAGTRMDKLGRKRLFASCRQTAAIQLRAHQGLHGVGNRCPSRQFGQLAHSHLRHFQTMKVYDRLENKVVQARRAVANSAAQKALDGLPFQDELAQLERYDKLIKLLPSSDRRNLRAASIIAGLCVFFAGLAWDWHIPSATFPSRLRRGLSISAWPTHCTSRAAGNSTKTPASVSQTSRS